MLPFNLNVNLGTRQSTCTAVEYTNALTFTQPATVALPAVNYIIERVDIDVTNMYLQVSYTHLLSPLSSPSLLYRVHFVSASTHSVQGIVTGKTLVQCIH